MNQLTSLIAFCLLMISLLAESTSALEIFISPQGNDKWSGRLAEPNAMASDGPVATLKQARELVRAARRQAQKAGKPVEPMFVTMRGGVYRLTEPFALAIVDSATENAPLTFRAYANEKPVITSAVEITKFESAGDGLIRAALPESIQPENVQMVLSKNRRLWMARYPNLGPGGAAAWAYVGGPLPVKSSDKVAEETEANRSKMTVRSEDRRTWKNPSQGELVIFPHVNYWNDIVPIQSFNAATGELTTAKPCSYTIRAGNRYFVQGIREELDQAGEWIVDQASRSLLLCTERAMKPVALDIPSLPNLITLRQGTTDIRFEKLIFEGCTQTAIHFIECQRCSLVGCTIRQVGDESGSGVYIQAGSKNRVIGCDVFDTGAVGIQVTGGDSKTLTPAENVVDNCHVHHVGVITRRSSGIAVSGVGNIVTHNSVHDCPRAAIMLQFGAGNQNNRIEFNHIYQFCLETQDSGGIYASGRDWVSGRGHIIRHNYVHDAIGFGWDEGKWRSPYYAVGIYLDDACSGVELYGNIVARCSRAAILVHSGRNNRIENNILIEGGDQQIELRGWKANQSYWQSALPTMRQRYREVKDEAAWKKMPGFIDPDQAATPEGLIMVDNSIQRNIIAYQKSDAWLLDIWNLPPGQLRSDANVVLVKSATPIVRLDKQPVAWRAWQASGQDVRSVHGDPRFKSLSKGDYELDRNSPAIKLGFEAIPVDKIGPYQDEARASWPL